MDFGKNKSIYLQDLKFDSIEDVIHKMELLSRSFESNKELHPLLSFLKVYLLVTKKVHERSLSGYFNNPKKLEELDIHFANLYFKPIFAYLENHVYQSPWSNYLKYSENNTDPFILMLLGINSHVNSDLLESLIELNYDEYDDFIAVNDILLETIPEIMSYLAIHEKDIWGLGGLIFYGFARDEFLKTVVRWRDEVWKNYQKIKSEKLQNKYLEYIRNDTEYIAENIADIFNDISHFKKIQKSFVRLNSLSASI